MPQPQRRRRPDQLPPGRHKLPPEFVRQSQRERLMNAVLEAVATHGFENTTLHEILPLSGVSRRTFYEQFEEKNDCFLAALDREYGRLADEAQKFADSGTWQKQIRDGVRLLLAHLARNPAVARACIVEVVSAGHAARAKRDAALRSLTFIVDAGRSVATQTVPGRTAVAVLGGALEIVAQELLYGSAEQLPRLGPDVVYLITVPFIGPRKALTERERARQELESGVTTITRKSTKASDDQPDTGKTRRTSRKSA